MGYRDPDYKKKWRESHKEEIKEYKRVYRLNNPEKIRIGQKKCYEAKKDKYKERVKKHQKDNYDECYSRIKEWNEKNPEKVKGYRHKTRHNPLRREKIREYGREYEKRPTVLIRKRLRCRLYCLLKKIGRYKEESILDYIGCTIDFLRDYLTAGAPPGFSWDDVEKGKWHIDHIVPCQAFYLKCKYHQRLCFNYTNLRILKAEDNLKKGKKHGVT